MSAQFIVLFRGQPVRFTFAAGQRAWGIIPRNMASIFSSEADAWHAAVQHGLRPDFTTVESLVKTTPARPLAAVVASFILLAAVAVQPACGGTASWYGAECARQPMANGQPFNPAALTCASWHYPFGTQLRVTNVANGRSVVVTVTDRGPHRRLKRAVDLSRAAFARIAPLNQGLVEVQIVRTGGTK